MPQRILAYLRQNAIALLALFIALGGASYAAIKVPAHSVGTKQLRNGAVTSKKLAKHSVTASKLDPKSITGHVTDWASVLASGQVVSSAPSATVTLADPKQGLYRISWHRSISPSCAEFANGFDGPVAPVTATTLTPEGLGASTVVAVRTFDSTGANVPENFNVLVLCP